MSRRDCRSLCWGISLLLAVSLVRRAGLHAAPGNSVPEEVIGKRVAEFRLTDRTGKMRTLAEWRGRKAIVLVFLRTECPIANSYAPVLSELADRYAGRGVQFVGVN